jgi:hypothetical protein
LGTRTNDHWETHPRLDQLSHPSGFAFSYYFSKVHVVNFMEMHILENIATTQTQDDTWTRTQKGIESHGLISASEPKINKFMKIG